MHPFSDSEAVASEEGSPRTAVSGQLQNLSLRSTAPKLDFGRRDDGEAAEKRLRLMREENGGWEDLDSNNPLPQGLESMENPSEASEEASARLPADEGRGKPTFEIPGTADLPLKTTRSPSPNSGEYIKPRARRKDHSPPPFSPPSAESLTWHDSEITGHAPTDPQDDGYGINGVGFRPTPAMAYARKQRRTQQISEWRSREAREARQKRSERRRGNAGGTMEGRDSRVMEERRKVRFQEG